MSLLSFPSASLPVSSVFLTELEMSLVSSPASSMPLSAFSGAVLLELRSRSMPFRAACALFSCICRLWVRRPFSPKDSAALARAERSVSFFCFCWSRFPCSEPRCGRLVLLWICRSCRTGNLTVSFQNREP